jgi:hypothetical protein
MKRLLAAFLTVCLIVVFCGCGNVFIGGALRPGFSTVTGTVSFIQVNTIISNGASVQVTFVTFVQNGISSSIHFCGDQTSQFPINQMVTTNFTPGQVCATLVVVVIIT